MKKNFIHLPKRFISNRIKPTFKNSLVVKLKSNQFEDYQNLANMISKNFQMISSSQIYQSEEYYHGLLEIESKSESIVEVEKLSRLINTHKRSQVFSEVKPISQIEERQSLFAKFKENQSKCSVFNNNNKLAGLIQCEIFPSQNGFRRIGEQRNDDYGHFIDKLEENKDFFEVVEIQGDSNEGVANKTMEILRLKKMIELIRDNQYIKNKIISVRTKFPEVAEICLQEGANIIKDPSGGKFDPNMIEFIAQSASPFILSLYLKDRNTDKTFYDAYVNSLEKSLNFCQRKGVLNSNIALDLNLDLMNRNQLNEFYSNIQNFRRDFDNIIISPFVGAADSSNQDIAFNLLFRSNFNLIRYNEFRHMRELNDYIKSNNLGAELGSTPQEIRYTTAKSVSDLPFYKFSLLKESETQLKNLFDLSKVKKEDELTQLIHKHKRQIEK